jgi:hypothetical protein
VAGVSFVRFGTDGSQVYIYDDIAVGPTCCFCALAKRSHDEGGNLHWVDFATRDLDAMLAHIAEHRAAGHTVPDWVDQVLRDEWEEPA